MKRLKWNADDEAHGASGDTYRLHNVGGEYQWWLYVNGKLYAHRKTRRDIKHEANIVEEIFIARDDAQ
jgi:hypothetical protein